MTNKGIKIERRCGYCGKIMKGKQKLNVCKRCGSDGLRASAEILLKNEKI